MLMSSDSPRPFDCWTCSEPMPISLPSGADQRRAAPERMRGRGEDRLVEMIFPVAGEFLLGDDAGPHRLLRPPPPPAHDHGFADLGRSSASELERRQSSSPIACTSAKPVSRRSRSDGPARRARCRRQPDVLRLGDEIADRQHQAVVGNDDAAAGPLRAEYGGGEGVFGDLGLQRNDGPQSLLEIEFKFARARLLGDRHFPSRLVGHGSLHTPVVSRGSTRFPQKLPAPSRFAFRGAISARSATFLRPGCVRQAETPSPGRRRRVRAGGKFR